MADDNKQNSELKQTLKPKTFTPAELAEKAAAFDARFGERAPITVQDLVSDEAKGFKPDDKQGEAKPYLVERHGSDQDSQRPFAALSEQQLIQEAQREHERFAELNQRFSAAKGDERAQLRQELKPIAERQAALRDEFVERRKNVAVTDFLQKLHSPTKPAGQKEYSREDLVRSLRIFAEKKAHLPLIPAEAAIAANLADQLEAGKKSIDLSQHYLTNDPAAAEERHRSAIENLAPVLREAERQTEKLSYGQAITHVNKHAEVLAIQDFRKGLNNAVGLLNKAGSHGQHQPNAPKLSMGGGL